MRIKLTIRVEGIARIGHDRPSRLIQRLHPNAEDVLGQLALIAGSLVGRSVAGNQGVVNPVRRLLKLKVGRVKQEALAVSAPSLNFADAVNNPGVPVTLPPVLFRGQSVDLNSATAFQVFAPDGTLTKGAPIRLRLLEGAEDSGTGIIYTGQQNGGQPANYYDIVLLRETGQPKVERF